MQAFEIIILILSVVTFLFWGVYLVLMYAWTASSPDDPKNFKIAFFVSVSHTFNYFIAFLGVAVILTIIIYVLLPLFNAQPIKIPILGT